MSQEPNFSLLNSANAGNEFTPENKVEAAGTAPSWQLLTLDPRTAVISRLFSQGFHSQGMWDEKQLCWCQGTVP